MGWGREGVWPHEVGSVASNGSLNLRIVRQAIGAGRDLDRSTGINQTEPTANNCSYI